MTEGTFDEHILQKLFTRLSSSFATYTPDKSVMDYLHQHSSSLQWEKKLDLRTPREKQSQDARPNKHEKRKKRPKERTERSKERTGRNKERTKKPDRGASHKRLKTSRSESGSRPRTPESKQCRRPACIETGNHLNHTHAKCRFASSSTRFSNLGKAPAKKAKPVGSSSWGKSQAPAHKPKQPAPKSLNGASVTEKRLCYICSSKAHLANACPQEEQNKSRARKTLTKDRNFKALWDEKLETLWGENELTHLSTTTLTTCDKLLVDPCSSDPSRKHIKTNPAPTKILPPSRWAKKERALRDEGGVKEV